MGTDIYIGSTGRAFSSYDLLDEMQTTYGLDRRETHEAILAFAEQVTSLDGADATIEDERAARPELLIDNSASVDVDHWRTISESAADDIRRAFAASFPAAGDEN